MSNRNNLLQQFEQFKRQFTGDPKNQVQQLLNSGKMTQQQFNHLQQLAQNILGAKF